MGGQADGEGTGAAGSRHGRLDKVKHAAIDEGRRYVISFVYIYVLLGMFTLHEEMALRAHGGASEAIPFAPHFFALVNALVLAKVALVVEDLRLAPRIRARPLIYPIVIEAALLAVLFIAMHVLEHVVAGLIHGERLAASVPAVGGGGAIGMAFAAFSFFVPMIPFCAFRQLTLEIGWPRIRALLFGTPEDARSQADR